MKTEMFHTYCMLFVHPTYPNHCVGTKLTLINSNDVISKPNLHSFSAFKYEKRAIANSCAPFDEGIIEMCRLTTPQCL